MAGSAHVRPMWTTICADSTPTRRRRADQLARTGGHLDRATDQGSVRLQASRPPRTSAPPGSRATKFADATSADRLRDKPAASARIRAASGRRPGGSGGSGGIVGLLLEIPAASILTTPYGRRSLVGL